MRLRQIDCRIVNLGKRGPGNPRISGLPETVLAIGDVFQPRFP
jgi:hypothetical protein